MNRGFGQIVNPAILARARAGDMSAHAELFRLFGGPVYTLARRLVKRVDVAEEITQDTFLDLMRRIESFREEAPFGYWLRRIAVNRCLMFLRTYWERHGEAAEDDIADDNDNFVAALHQADLRVLLDQLPALGRTVVWLHDVEGYTHQEIGELLGRTASFSKSQLARSYQRLRELVANEDSVSEVPACTSTPAN